MKKIGRNDPCPCGSGKKFKTCCMSLPKVSDMGLIHYSADHETIKEDFIRKGIDINTPGFYNQNNFLLVEKNQPLYLNNYARYVQSKAYTEDYIECARKEIRLIASILHNELVKDGRKGACIDMSMTLSKILEKEGYWNYVVKGALTLNYPLESGLSDAHYFPIDNNTIASAGHAWVVAPPFSVIDITIKQQPYTRNEEKFLPDLVLEENGTLYPATVKDIIASDIRMNFKYQGLREEQILDAIGSDVDNVIKVFPSLTSKHGQTSLNYVTTAISAPIEELEDIKGLHLNGMYGVDIYNNLIIPELKKQRENAI